MAQEENNLSKSSGDSGKMRKDAEFWRTFLDEHVVDLREAAASKEVEKNIVDLAKKPVNIKKNEAPEPSGKVIKDIDTAKVEKKDIFDRGAKPDPQTESSGEEAEAFFDSEDIEQEQAPDYTEDLLKLSPTSRPEFHEALSREKISKQLASIDEADLEIQDTLPKIEKPAPQNETFSGREAKTEQGQRDSFNLIPRETSQVSEKKRDTEEAKGGSDLLNAAGGQTPLSREEFEPESKLKPEPKPKPSFKNTPARSEPAETKPESALRLSDREQKELRKKILQDRKIRPGILSRNKLIAGLFLGLFLGVSLLAVQKANSLKGEGQARAEMAYGFMRAGQEALFNLNAEKAKDNFSRAEDEFNRISGTFTFLGQNIVNLSAKMPVQSQLSSVGHMVEAGRLYASAGVHASDALYSIHDMDYTNSEVRLTDNLVIAASKLKSASGLLEKANTELSYVRPQDVPREFEKDIRAVQTQTTEVEGMFEELFSSLDTMLTFLGHNQPKNYLLIFQNNSELRATGGFIGTYGLLQLNKGSLDDLLIEGIYWPDGQLRAKVVPPRPLQYVTGNLGTRDANWFFDFPTSAQKLMWFYKQTGQFDGELDGVIALNTDVLTELLEISGPIEMSEYGMTLNSDNWLPLVQQQVEVDYDKERNRPKQILADMTPILIERLTEGENKIELIDAFLSALEKKDMFLYSEDKSVAALAGQQNWDGAVRNESNGSDNTVRDYLAVVASNIGGWKTDIYTDTEIDTVTKISDTGDITRTVIISRVHRGGNTPYFFYNKPNHGYIRVYVPADSELISADGFSSEPDYIETDYKGENYSSDFAVANSINSAQKGPGGVDVFEESEKRVFGGWMWIPAGERAIATVTYKLPSKSDKNTSSYNLHIQKQSGLDAMYSGSVEEFDSSLSISACYKDEENISPGHFSFLQEADTTIKCPMKFE